MKIFYDVIVIIPIGPGVLARHTEDTILSVQHYMKCKYVIILADDSHEDAGKKCKTTFNTIDVVTTRRNNGRLGGLYRTLSLAYKYALDNYDFTTVLKLDVDALIINYKPEEEALALFIKNPLKGMAGQYPNDYDNVPWNLAWPRQRIINGTVTWKYIRRPFANFVLRGLLKRAKSNGYKTGESVFGGAYYISQICLQKLSDQGLLPSRLLAGVRLEEDHIFSLLTKAVGLDLGDLSTGNLPFACEWKGLPDSPENLYHSGKKIVHSTRKWQSMNETDIRNYFSHMRKSLEALSIL